MGRENQPSRSRAGHAEPPSAAGHWGLGEFLGANLWRPTCEPLRLTHNEAGHGGLATSGPARAETIARARVPEVAADAPPRDEQYPEFWRGPNFTASYSTSYVIGHRSDHKGPVPQNWQEFFDLKIPGVRMVCNYRTARLSSRFWETASHGQHVSVRCRARSEEAQVDGQEPDGLVTPPL
jgi:hypothetical protein